ncbi:MAG TPA: glycosyltransferase family 39 protein [Candidatus Sumerlaeota bacterium]|nr:glycosyltransferase family 39 protein [Candidatus Sumerlaeota bacterium]
MDSANQSRPGAGRRARPTRAGRRGLPLLLLLGVALLWRLMFLLAIHDTPAGQWHQWDQSDMHTYLMQGRQLAAGDWLAREPYYPYHLWMSAGSPAAWRALYPPHVFHQAPLLSYGLALFLRFGVDPVPWIRLLHAVLGLINTYLLYRLGRLLGGRVAGLVAGLFGALYGPLLVIESQPLREPAALALTLLALLCVAAMPIRRKGGRERTRALAFGAGFATGVLALLHEAAAVVLLSAALALAWDGLVVRRAPRRFAACLALLLGGALIGFLPLLARNLAVGAPPFAQSTRSALTWAMANHPDAPWGGVRWTGPDASFFETLEGTRGRPLRVVIRTLAAYEGAPWRWALNWGRRALALLIGGEASDNTSHAWFRLHVPILALSLDFRWLFALGAAGLLRRGRRGGCGRPAPMLATYGLLMLAALSSVFPLGRYRLFLLPCLAPFAGRLAAQAWAARRKANWRRLGGMGALVLAVLLGQMALDRAFGAIAAPRPVDFSVAARMLTEWGNPAAAAAELELAAEQGVLTPAMKVELSLAHARAALLAGAEQQALASLESAGRWLAELDEPPPNASAIARESAWLKLTAADASLRDPDGAERIVQGLELRENGRAELLDLKAALAAARGQFDVAIGLATEALEAARGGGDEVQARFIQRRLERYHAGRPATRP